MSHNIEPYLVRDVLLKEAVSKLDKNGKGVVMVATANNQLIGILTDGDLRRYLLQGGSMLDSVLAAANTECTTWPVSNNRDQGVSFLEEKKLRHLPVVDNEGVVCDLILEHELNANSELSNLIFIMVGGQGIRLRPHTEQCPKPMLEVGGKPMLEHICHYFKGQGFMHFSFAINYLGHIVEEYFGNGNNLGLSIEYIREKKRLGTAGALSLVTNEKKPSESFFVTNGDVMTTVNARQMLYYHNDHCADITVGVRPYEMQVPFGVLETEDLELRTIVEKPKYTFQINAAFYCVEPEILNLLVYDEYCDMPELVQKAKDKGKKVIIYPIRESWVDVGRPEELDQVREHNPLSK